MSSTASGGGDPLSQAESLTPEQAQAMAVIQNGLASAKATVGYEAAVAALAAVLETYRSSGVTRRFIHKHMQKIVEIFLLQEYSARSTNVDCIFKTLHSCCRCVVVSLSRCQVAPRLGFARIRQSSARLTHCCLFSFHTHSLARSSSSSSSPSSSPSSSSSSSTAAATRPPCQRHQRHPLSAPGSSSGCSLTTPYRGRHTCPR